MTSELYRFTTPVTPGMLAGILSGRDRVQTEALGVTADMSLVLRCFEDLKSQVVQRSAWDGELLEPIHSSLSHLKRTQVCDMRFWHWMCTVELPELVWYRWHGSIPGDIHRQPIGPALANRFLGSRTLNGFGHNTLARIWWCAETLYDDVDGYALAREAISNQDFYQSIFDREFALYPPAAKACVRGLKASSEEERRRVTRELNHYFTTIAVETLEEADIIDLIDEIRG